MTIHWANVAWFCYGAGMAEMNYHPKMGLIFLLCGAVGSTVSHLIRRSNP